MGDDEKIMSEEKQVADNLNTDSLNKTINRVTLTCLTHETLVLP